MHDRRYFWVLFIFILVLTGCTSGGGDTNGGTGSQETAATATTAGETAVATDLPTPTPESTPTPTPWDVPSVEPSATPSVTAGPAAETPSGLLPGFRYMTAAGIWQIDADGQPVLLTDRAGAVISPDGTQALYIEEQDIWLLELASGESRNLTADSGRVHCCLQWPEARPETIIFGSWDEEDLGPSTGHLSVMDSGGGQYRVLSEVESNALPDISPDGQQIAYDQAGTAWIYDFTTGASQQIEPAAYGLENVQRIGGPSWSPDGRRIAWTVAATNPDWRISVVVIDLEANSLQQFHEYENIGRGGWFPGPAWHPGGEWLAFVAEAVDPERFGVWLLNNLTGEELFLGRGINPIWSPDGRWLAYEQYSSPDSSQIIPTLVAFGSWQQSTLPLPDDGQLVEWVVP